MAKIVIERADGTPRVVNAKPVDLERVLQENIKRLPELIPIEEATGKPLRLLPIGFEVGVPSGAIDLLLLDSDGVLTIVETKLAKNPEIRREVIGQVLEYAAYVSEWGMEKIEHEAERYFASEHATEEFQNRRFDDALTRFLGVTDSESEELGAFLDRIGENLRAGKLRLIVAADRLVETARKTITFVNTYSSFEIYLLQITCYEDDDRTRVYVPSLYGYARKVKPEPPPAPWTWERYQSELGWSLDTVEAAKSLARKLEELAQDLGPEERLHAGWISVRCLGRSVFGVQVFKRRGLELWFRLKDNPVKSLPKGLYQRQTREYLYLGGNVLSLGDDAIRRLCEASVKQLGVEDSDD